MTCPLQHAQKDASCIKLGETSDTGIYRTGAKELTIDAKNGVNINSDNLKIGGKTLKEIIDAAVKAALAAAKPPLKESGFCDAFSCHSPYSNFLPLLPDDLQINGIISGVLIAGTQRIRRP